LIDDDLQNNDYIPATLPPSITQTSERVITPIQPPLQPRIPVGQQHTGVFASAPNAANPTFTVLKATTIPLVIGHPLAYVRVLMQVRYLKTIIVLKKSH
jgi:hypothetical protein